MNEKLAKLSLKDEDGDHPEVPSLLDLNDDCLYEILKYLEAKDLLIIRMTHSRFKPMFVRLGKRHFDEFIVNPETLKRYPLANYMDGYNAIGELTTTLDIMDVDEKAVTAILPCFTGIRRLDIVVKKLKDLRPIETFPLIQKLVLDVGDTQKNYLKVLFQWFSPSLETLNLRNTLRADLSLLPNLKRLKLDGLWLGSKTSFWKSTTKLELLLIQNGGWDPASGEEDFYDFNIVKNNWKDIANIQSLKDLTWFSLSPQNLRPGIIPFFTHITNLELALDDSRLALPVLQKFGPQLKRLKFSLKDSNEQRGVCLGLLKLIVKNFPLLELLAYSIPLLTLMESEVQPLHVLTNLETAMFPLHPAEASFNFARAMPNLTAFYNMDFDPTFNNLVAPDDLLESRRKTNRSLWISGKNFFVAPGEAEMTTERFVRHFKHPF